MLKAVKNNHPLISVVLPVYNVENYIGEAIESILQQTIQDFEILIIDDCSTDNTLDVVRAYDDERIKIITKACNKGLIDSLNIGFELAKGKYIARMDGDDISNLKRFEKQLYILENNPDIKACGCWLQEFGISSKIKKQNELHEEISANLLWNCSMTLGSVMMDSLWAKQFQFNELKKHVEDYDFWAKMHTKGRFYNIQEVLYHYRVHNSQVSHLHHTTQKLGDVDIKLELYSSLNYNQSTYPTIVLQKMLYGKETFRPKELKIFLQFLGEIEFLNQSRKVFDSHFLAKVHQKYIQMYIQRIFFLNNETWITKKQRMLFLIQFPVSLQVSILLKKIRLKYFNGK